MWTWIAETTTDEKKQMEKHGGSSMYKSQQIVDETLLTRLHNKKVITQTNVTVICEQGKVKMRCGQCFLNKIMWTRLRGQFFYGQDQQNMLLIVKATTM